MNSFFNNPAAFAPFFGDVIAVSGRRRADGEVREFAGTFSACVLETSFSDAAVETDADSSVRTFSVSVATGDWLDGQRPQIGDRIRLADGLTLAVSHVDNLAGDTWTLSAREVK